MNTIEQNTEQKQIDDNPLQTEEEIPMDSLRSSISNNFGDYIVQAPIGRGAGSFVVKVQSRKTQKEYAVKVIDKKSEQYKNIKLRLSNEINIHSELNHENIVKLVNSFEDSDNHYLMLEYCQTGDLFHFLKGKGKFTEQEAQNLSYQLALGIQYLHDNKIMHRDLKLGNILVTDQQNLKICDLGLAIKLSDLDQERNTICGTPNYLSPEIINREPYGFKIDCWSFGCILYALVTGKPPFESQSVQETLKKVSKVQKLDLPSYFSPNLQDLINKVLTWNTDERLGINEILKHPFYTQIRNENFPPTPILKFKNNNSNKNSTIDMPRQSQQLPKQSQQYQQQSKLKQSLNLQNCISQEICMSKEKINIYVDKNLKQSIQLQQQQNQQNNINLKQKSKSPIPKHPNMPLRPSNIQNNNNQQYINQQQYQNYNNNNINSSNNLNSLKNSQIQIKTDEDQNSYLKKYSKQNLQQLITQQQNKKQNIQQQEKLNLLQQQQQNQIISKHEYQKSLQENQLSSYKDEIQEIYQQQQQQLQSHRRYKTNNHTNNNHNNNNLDQQNHKKNISQGQKQLHQKYQSLNTSTLDNSYNLRENSQDYIQNKCNQSEKEIQQEYQMGNNYKLNKNLNLQQRQSMVNLNQFNNTTQTPFYQKQNNKNFGYYQQSEQPQKQFQQQFQYQQEISQLTSRNSSASSRQNQSQQIQSDRILQKNSNSLKRKQKLQHQILNAGSQQNLEMLETQENQQQQNQNYEDKKYQYYIKTEPSEIGYNLKNMGISNNTTTKVKVSQKNPVQNLINQQEYYATSKHQSKNTSNYNSFMMEDTNNLQNNYNTQEIFDNTKQMKSINSLSTLDMNAINLQTLADEEVSQQNQKKLSPIKVNTVKPYKFQTKNGYIEITKDRQLIVQACNGKLHFNISQDGHKITVLKSMETQNFIKNYTLLELPKKYHDLYKYAKQVSKILLSKTAKVKLSNDDGKFTLMENGQFEGIFNDGTQVQIETNNPNNLIIKTPTQLNFEINLDQIENCDYLNTQLLKIVRKTQNYYKSIINGCREEQNLEQNLQQKFKNTQQQEQIQIQKNQKKQQNQLFQNQLNQQQYQQQQNQYLNNKNKNSYLKQQQLQYQLGCKQKQQVNNNQYNIQKQQINTKAQKLR